MKFVATFLSALVLLAALVNGNENVAELRKQRRALGYRYGGDNGRDHPQYYNRTDTSSDDVPAPAPAADVS